jgi:hypothetical protein
METVIDWKVEYQHEIEHACAARTAGNEGMARVCARRATGIIISEYLRRFGYTNISTSIFDQISLFLSLPGIDSQCRDTVSHFVMKVNSDHSLPSEVDLISDAHWLAENLLFERTN